MKRLLSFTNNKLFDAGGPIMLIGLLWFPLLAVAGIVLLSIGVTKLIKRAKEKQDRLYPKDPNDPANW